MEIKIGDLTVDLKLGADPEVFASHNGKLVSAHGMVKGTKESPHPVSCGAIQVDGMALEFNIDASDTEETFVKNIMTVMQELSSQLPSGVTVDITPTAEFGAAYIASQPIAAQELGCSSDINAYTQQDNPKPNESAPFRTAAGHVHIGWTEGANEEDDEHLSCCYDLVKIFDLYLGVPSVLLDPDTKRRSLYGAAGAFRSKSYGAEYRVLSNFWLKSEGSMKWVYKQVTRAVTDYLEGFRVSGEEVICHAINTSDVEAAKALIKHHNLEMPYA